MKTMTELLQLFPNNQTILEAVLKLEDHIATGQKIMVSVSGGSDSDIVVDMVERVGYAPGQVVYVWFDTGLEYEATKRHLVFLEQKYGVEIQRRRAKKPIPVAVKEYGVPFISKETSQKISYLQAHNFDYSDQPPQDLLAQYPNAKSGVTWWCNGRGRKWGIDSLAGLKEFMMQEHPPVCSDKCCKYAKKDPSKDAEKDLNVALVLTGERKTEGGIRSSRTCFSQAGGGRVARFRPIFYFTDSVKAEYEGFCGVVHSDCYTVYGMKRTGCAGCPFNSKFEQDLEVVKQYEPKLYLAANAIFGESYDYTRRYREFKEKFKREKRRNGQIDLFDRWEEWGETDGDQSE